MAELKPNFTLAHYRIVSKIGAGGMGDVYLAQDTKLDRQVALKILPPEFAEDKDRMSRFVREAKSASALNHPNIITIYEIGEVDGTHFIATEFIEGKTLNQYVKSSALDFNATLDIAVQIASALAEAHSAGIVHRDIKPDNVMIRSNGLVKVLDFGIAKQFEERRGDAGTRRRGEDEQTLIAASPRPPISASQETSPGMIIGTANYMSPEQACGKVVDARSDMFSFGVVLYEMLSGHLPFQGETPMEMIGAILHKEPLPLNGVPTEVRTLIDKCLRKDRDGRYQTSQDICSDLRQTQMRLLVQAELQRTSSPHLKEAHTQIRQAQTTTESETRNSIAVLPFTNMSADAENEYFCDGLSEELLNALAKIDDLKVAARSSSFSFKGKNAEVSQIGGALNVKTVLEGSVRRSGDRIRITVQLINAADGYHLWSERYDRQLQDIFDVQDEITLAVVDALKLKLFSSEREEILKRYTKNAEAYQHYLNGRFFFLKRTPEGFKKAIDYFEKAIEHDSEYALAFAGIADCYTLLGFYEVMPPARAKEHVQTAVFKAIELDKTVAETHASLAIYLEFYEWKFDESAVEFAEAIRLNPNYALSHHLNSGIMILIGSPDEAIAEELRAVEIEPFTAIFNATTAWWLYLANRNDEAIEQARKTIEIASSHFFAHWVLGLAYARVAKYEEAISVLEKALTLTAGNQHILGELGRVYALSGRRDEALKILDEFLRQAKESYVSAVNIVKIYAGLGEKEKVIEWLERAYDERAVKLPWFITDPCLDSFRHDQRFQSVLKRMGLPVSETRPTEEGLEAKTVLLSGEVKSEQSGDVNIQKTDVNQSSNQKSKTKLQKSIWWLFSLLTLVVLAGGYFSYRVYQSSLPINSIAVLPFENKSSDADTEYLSDGLAESLIYRLSQLPDLKVSPTSSVFRYKGKENDALKAASELGVNAIMTGRIAQRGENLIISVELVDVRNRKLLWGEQYERKMSDLLATQREIAAEITNKLRLKLSGDEKGLTKRYTNNNDAYQLYLKGRYHFAKRTKDDVLKGIEYFQQAIKLDPNFALAYARIAESYGSMPAYPFLTPKEAFPQAKAAAQRAIEIDPTLAEAHTFLAYSSAVYDWNWVEAEREFKRAIELDPNNSSARFRYGQIYLAPLGRSDEAITQVKLAMEMEPLDLNLGGNFAWVYLAARQYGQALEQGKKTHELEPGFLTARWNLSHAYIVNGMYAEALALSEHNLAVAPTNQFMLQASGYGFAKSGRRREAEEAIKKFKDIAKTQYVMSYWIASIYAALGEKDRAFAELENAFAARDWYLHRLKVDSFWDPLRDDPRFKEMLKRLNLSE